MKLLSVNAGSSSLKFRVYEMPEEKLLMKGMFERIGLDGSSYNIRIGEEKYIYPYQDDADAMINSSLLYEISVLKIYAEPLLFSVPENSPMYPEALRLINFLRNFLPMPSDQIPNDSVLREFIGGSCFK